MNIRKMTIEDMCFTTEKQEFDIINMKTRFLLWQITISQREIIQQNNMANKI